MQSIRILLVEDHDVVSSGVMHELEQSMNSPYTLFIAASADLGFKKLQQETFDVVLLDIVLKNELPNPQFLGGDDLLHRINKMSRRPKVVVLSKIDRLDMLDYIINILDADGYILKSRESLREIVPAILSVLDGNHFYSPAIEKILRFNESLLEIDFTDRVALSGLSQGLIQREIVDLLAQKEVILTVSALEKRIRRLKVRFEAKTSAQLVAKAVKEGII
ncbi:MAG: response regulator [Bacteroidota bacterium]